MVSPFSFSLLVEVHGEDAATEPFHHLYYPQVVGMLLVALHGLEIGETRDQGEIVRPFGANHVPPEVEFLNLRNDTREGDQPLLQLDNVWLLDLGLELEEYHVLQHDSDLLCALLPEEPSYKTFRNTDNPARELGLFSFLSSLYDFPAEGKRYEGVEGELRRKECHPITRIEYGIESSPPAVHQDQFHPFRREAERGKDVGNETPSGQGKVMFLTGCSCLMPERAAQEYCNLHLHTLPQSPNS
jgi:hypothetical protein